MKTAFSATAILLASTVGVALAQNSTVTLPFAACLLPCDTAALEAVNCTAEDLLCHCEHAPTLFSLIVPCVLSNSTCGSNTTADLLSFGTFAADSCVPYNISVPSISNYFPNTTTTNVTASSTPIPTVYSGAAGKAVEASVWAAIVGAAGFALAL